MPPRDYAVVSQTVDNAGYTIVCTPHALAVWDLHSLGGEQVFACTKRERRTGQGDIHSPFTWMGVFNFLLCMLERAPCAEHDTLPCDDRIAHYTTPETLCYDYSLQWRSGGLQT